MMRNTGGALPARHFLGNYELFEELGRGGMGIVYRALDLSLDRVVAIKILRDDLRAHQSIVTRFSREAQAAARLDHTNIVQIYTVGVAERTPYIAMEYIDAMPLSALMQREHRLDWQTALGIARQVAAALACAHDSHVIHRDVKPPNILLDDRKHAYVTDFGIAKILTLDDNLTVDGTRLGTPHYMAPERCKSGEVTAASDLYSLGVVLFQMLTGRLPYEASSPVEMIQRIISEPPARVRNYVPEVPEDVERLVAWLMEMNPKHRPASGHVACEAIDRVIAGKPLDTSELRPAEMIEDFRRSLATFAEAQPAAADADSRRKTTIRRIAAGVVGALTLGLGAWFAVSWTSSPTPALTGSASDVGAWFEPASVATFSEEGSSVHLAELQFPGYHIVSLTNAGADGSVAALLENGAGKRVLCVVSPELQDARIRMVSNSDAPLALASAVQGLPGSLFDGFALLHSGSESAFMSLRPSGSQGPLAVLPTALEVADIHPSGSLWAAAIPHEGGFALSAFRWENGVVSQQIIAPSGPRITRVQYSPDGERIAYLRDAGAGSYALHVIAASGVTEEPLAIAKGPLAIGNSPFNASGDAILVSDEAQGSVRAISTISGALIADFGASLRGAWDITSDSIVLTAPDKDGVAQLWRVRANAPAVRTQLTFLDSGTDRTVSTTRNGQWAITHGASGIRSALPSLVFVRLAP